MPASPTAITGLFPYDVGNLLTGPARVLYAPASEPEPVDLSDVFTQVGPDYAPVGNWKDFGATESGANVARNLTTQDLRIEQSTAIILEEVTGLERTVTVPLAEINPTSLAVFEQSRAGSSSVVTASAAAAPKKHSAFDKVPVGTVTSLYRYRLAVVAMRDQSAGVVVEPTTGVNRGRFYAFIGFSAAISAENSSLALARNALSAIPMTFRFFPVGGKPEGAEHGYHLDERAGSIVA